MVFSREGAKVALAASKICLAGSGLESFSNDATSPDWFAVARTKIGFTMVGLQSFHTK
jgi:hypothetical protein